MQNDAISRSGMVCLVEQSSKDAGLHYEDAQKFLRWLRKAPALDVVQVVRCKDCKHALSTTGECVKCTIWREWMPNDGFCSEGGRSV